MFLFRVAADIGEGQHDDREARRPVLRHGRDAPPGRGASRASLDRVDPDWPRDILERLLAEIREVRVDFAQRMFISGGRNQHFARFAYPLEPSGDVDPIAQNVVALDQHVAEIDAYAIDDSFRLRYVGVALDHQILDSDGA